MRWNINIKNNEFIFKNYLRWRWKRFLHRVCDICRWTAVAGSGVGWTKVLKEKTFLDDASTVLAFSCDLEIIFTMTLDCVCSFYKSQKVTNCLWTSNQKTAAKSHNKVIYIKTEREEVNVSIFGINQNGAICLKFGWSNVKHLRILWRKQIAWKRLLLARRSWRLLFMVNKKSSDIIASIKRTVWTSANRVIIFVKLHRHHIIRTTIFSVVRFVNSAIENRERLSH